MAISSPRLRALGLIAAFFAAIFIIIQFIGPRVTNPPVRHIDDELIYQQPAELKALLKTSCYNCHSNETHLWWYDKIAPASWLVARDVRRGRMHLNFSTFGQLSIAQQTAVLYESVNQIQLGTMPPANYLFVHPEAKVTQQQLDIFKQFLHRDDTVTVSDQKVFDASEAQFRKWAASRNPGSTGNVSPTPNGLAFFPDYATWKPVSYTDRFDNHTMRIILGNDVAQKAIASGNVKPWPDGTAFAKIAYRQQIDPHGTIWTGEFLQVEFMLKDAAKYKSTEGWGFGRWKGDDLKPYGENANFTTECTSCHRPMEPNDFVYTMPLRTDGTPPDAFNPTAALPTHLPVPIADWHVITTNYDHKNHTMSALYGTAAAVARAQMAPLPAIMQGDLQMALVTWQQQDDKHWFGGLIPGTLQSVEVLHAISVNPVNTVFDYKYYAGSPLQEQKQDDATAQQRISFIAGLRAAMMP